jgi:hypothetical protein
MPDPTYLFIPADSSVPVRIGTLTDGRDQVARLVGGYPERTTYDHDADMFVNGTGRVEGQQLNGRATDYILNESAAAKQGKMTNAAQDGYVLYGDVVVTGPSADRFTGVPDRLIDLFSVRTQAAARAQIQPVRSPVVEHGLET